MNWKNTVRKVQPHDFSITCEYCGEEFGIEDIIENDRELQAEISYKAGIREVVEWLRKHMTFMEWEYEDSKGIWYCPIDDNEWQAKLKEWG